MHACFVVGGCFVSSHELKQDMLRTCWESLSFVVFVACPLVREPGGPTVHLPPPPPPQEPSTMVPKCTLGCLEHNVTCSPESHWDALEL